MNNIIIYLLPKIYFLTLQKNNNKYIYIYNNNLFFFINITNYSFFFKKILNILELKNNYKNISNINISNYLNDFLFSWDYIFNKKIIFSGKGFKIRKKKNYLFLFFNRSHASLLICNNIIIKKIQKNKILFFYKNWIKYSNTFKNIIQIRPANIYTKRGLRFSRQIILKRKGKGGVQTQQ